MFHNRCIDFYHLGALLYEILCGLPPFFSEDRTKMYRDIIYSPILIPSFLSDECRHLLRSLLEKNPNKRLGSMNGVKEIKEHPWCADIDWAKIMKK
jgi:serine/threonine protein kinase